MFKYFCFKLSVNKLGNKERGKNLLRKMIIFCLFLNFKIFGINFENSLKIFFISCKLNIGSECFYCEYKYKCKNIKLLVLKKIVFFV